MDDEQSILSFEPDDTGLTVVDTLEQTRARLETGRPTTPAPVDPEPFYYPVDSGVRITAGAVTLPTPSVAVIVRDGSGTMVAKVDQLDDIELGEGSYALELSTQVKTYLELDGPLTITQLAVETHIEFDGLRTIRVGARSRHERPAATITTTADPTDLMTAIGAFGSALKTTSPERSWPTLRGHPPAVELGDELAVPEVARPPETGVEIAVPATHRHVLPVASLAYYLGARVVPGERPALRAPAADFEHDLTAPEFERAVERTLKQVFVLDCATRTDGLYEIDLHERAQLEEQTDLAFEELYERPLSERLAAYLSVPFEAVAPAVPDWRLTAHVEPSAEAIERLPFVANDLGIVRTTAETTDRAGAAVAPETEVDGPPEAELEASRSHSRGAGGAASGLTRGASETVTNEEYIQLDRTDAIEQAFIGEGVPIGGTKLLTAAFHNRFDRELTAGDISITVVSNDTRMAEERDLVSQVYGDREELPFEVTVRRNLTAEQLRATLEGDQQFLHYIGHIEADGLVCTDGKLDATTIDSVGVESFLLNACNSYRQGRALIEAGAVGGIVTLNEILSDRAVGMGETIAKLLNQGFPLYAALDIASEESIIGGQYMIVGNGNTTVTQAPSRTPILLDISKKSDQLNISIHAYTTSEADIGSVYVPYIQNKNKYYLNSGVIGEFTPTQTQLEDFLQMQEHPTRIDNNLTWSSSLVIDELE
ncbi:hypothetical protein BRC62_07365 [Halobacteriales archaeon QH_10_67_13]|nr:MAG: hypothetical protein BRC62_07365 [Halobacteriales archaeon QH_10_67_13]